MKTLRAPASDLKEKAGDLLAQLRFGVVDEVVITRYGKPVAKLVSCTGQSAEDPAPAPPPAGVILSHRRRRPRRTSKKKGAN